MKDCPVCAKVGLGDDVRECPQCNADLECFDLLDALHEEVVEPGWSEPGPSWTNELGDIRASVNGIRDTLRRPPKSGGIPTHGIAALLVLGLIALLLFLYRDYMRERRIDDMISRLESQTSPVDAGLQAKELSALIAKMETITQRIRAMDQGLSALSANQEAADEHLSAGLEHLNRISERLVSLEQGLSDLTAELSPPANATDGPLVLAHEDMFLYHEPHEGETLWSIAERHYGDGRFYPVLLEHNPGLGVYFDRCYGSIRILKDRQQAQEVLVDVMAARGNLSLFRYKVVAGDTWERISTRFYGQASKSTELAALNPPAGLVPGERVFIPLQ